MFFGLFVVSASRNVGDSEREIDTLNDNIMSDSSATSKDVVDRSFRTNVDDDSSNNTLLDRSSNSNLYMTNNTNPNRYADSEKERNVAETEETQMNKIIQKIIFSLIRLASDQINSYKYSHSRNETNENVKSDVEEPTVIQLETVVQSQKADNADLLAKAIKTLPNDTTTRTENSQDLNNLTQKITPEVGDLAKKEVTGLKKSIFSNIGGFASDQSPRKANDNKQEITSADNTPVKRIRAFEKIVGKNFIIHQKEDVETRKRAAVLSGLQRLFKRSNFKRSIKDKKSRRMILTKDIEKDSAITNREGMNVFKKQILQKQNNKESNEENAKVSDLFDNKDTFKKEAGFVEFQKKKDFDSSYMSKLKNSANLNNGNLYRSLVKKDSDVDLPNIDLSDVLYNVDRSELQAYGADIEPVKQDECQFLKDNMKNQQGNVPAQLNMIHINHHVISKTNCPSNEDYIDYPENSKVYKITSFDSSPIKAKPDFMSLYGQKKNTHTTEELNDVFKQVELEVLGLDDDSIYQEGLLKNYSKAEVDDIFKKLYFEIFDINEDKNFDEPFMEDVTDKDRDRIFKDLNFHVDDEYQNTIDNGGLNGYDVIKGCKDMEKIACQKTLDEILSKDTGKADGRNNYNSVDFSIMDKNGVMHGLEGIIGFKKPQGSNGKKKGDISFYITQECFENITQNRGLGLNDIQRARMNCTDSTFNYNNNDNIGQKAGDLNEKVNLESLESSTESLISQTTVNEDNRGKVEWNETSDTDSESYTNASVSENSESSDGEDSNLKNKPHPKNDSESNSANGSE